MISSLLRLTKLALAILHGLTLDRPKPTPISRAHWQQRQALRMLRALGTNTTISGTIPSCGLIVSNHLSYLDVLVIASQAPLVFVAKSDVRKWPIIGLLLKSAGTILADRTRRTSTSVTSAAIFHAIQAGLPVVLFPEGTSSDGSTVLPFKPALLQSALDTHKPITPAAISYSAPSGNIKNDVCYWGTHTFTTHLYRLATIQNLTANLTIGPSTILPENRKTAASLLHSQVFNLFSPSS